MHIACNKAFHCNIHFDLMTWLYYWWLLFTDGYPLVSLVIFWSSIMYTVIKLQLFICTACQSLFSFSCPLWIFLLWIIGKLFLLTHQILMTPEFPLKLGPRVFALLLDIFLYHDFSVLNFIKGLQVFWNIYMFVEWKETSSELDKHFKIRCNEKKNHNMCFGYRILISGEVL